MAYYSMLYYNVTLNYATTSPASGNARLREVVEEFVHDTNTTNNTNHINNISNK